MEEGISEQDDNAIARVKKLKHSDGVLIGPFSGLFHSRVKSFFKESQVNT